MDTHKDKTDYTTNAPSKNARTSLFRTISLHGFEPTDPYPNTIEDYYKLRDIHNARMASKAVSCSKR
jgi:hypothetical protein